MVFSDAGICSPFFGSFCLLPVKVNNFVYCTAIYFSRNNSKIVMKKRLVPLNGLLIFILWICFTFPVQDASGQSPLFRVDTSYLSRHDIVYKTPAYEGFEGFPLGNGDMGGMMWNRPDGV